MSLINPSLSLSEPFIRRPVMTAVSTASVVLFGVLCYLRLPVNDGRTIRPSDEPTIADISPDWHSCLAEALTAVRDAPLREVDDHEPLAHVLQVVRPSPVPGCYLEDGPGGHEGVDPREECAEPQRRRPSPPA